LTCCRSSFLVILHLRFDIDSTTTSGRVVQPSFPVLLPVAVRAVSAALGTASSRMRCAGGSWEVYTGVYRGVYRGVYTAGHQKRPNYGLFSAPDAGKRRPASSSASSIVIVVLRHRHPSSSSSSIVIVVVRQRSRQEYFASSSVLLN